MFELPARPKETVPVFTDGPFAVATLPWRFKADADVLVVIAKSTHALRPGKAATPLDESNPLCGDLHWDDDPSASLRYASDFAPLKAKADVWLTGSAHPSPGSSTATAGLTLGGMSRHVALIGDRYWEAMGMTRPSALKPLELRYESAYGGVGFAANPVGRGYIEGGGARLLPNLEDPAQLIKSPRDRPAPASLGPLAQTWQQRQAFMGTYDDRWLEQHWPYFPEDFNYQHFNAAPPAQQLDLIAGTERFTLDGVHPSISSFEGRLPGRKARAFVQTTREHGFRFSEVTLKLDTVAFDMDALTVELVWRGFLQVSSSLAPEVALIYVTSDDCMRPVEVELCRRRFSAWLTGGAPVEAQAMGLRFGLRDPKVEAQQRLERERLGQRLPLRDAPSQPRSAAPAAPALSRTEVEELFTSGASTADLDLSGSDLSRLDLAGRDLSRSKLHGANLAACELTGAILNGASLIGADLTGANLASSDLSDANLAEARLDGCQLTQAKLPGANLSGARGRATNFSYADLSGANLSDSDLEAANFASSDLSGADLSSAKLRSANFNSAKLEDTIAYEAELMSACFDFAQLRCFRADQADLSGASLYEAQAPEASFAEAKLAGARLDLCDLTEAVLNNADLSGANLGRCVLKGARLRYAVLTDARAGLANLMEANLEQADLSRGDFRGANFHGAETLEAKLDGTLLDQAILTGTKLVHPILKRRGKQ